MSRDRVLAIFFVTVMATAVAWSQEPTPQKLPEEAAPASPESGLLTEVERKELEALTSPGLRFETWEEFVEWWTTPRPFDKDWVLRIDETYAYPHRVASTKMIIVREDEKHVWLRGAHPEDPNSPLHKMWARREAQQAVQLTLAEMASKPGAQYYLNFAAEVVPPPFMESLTFEPVAATLPTRGRWQMGFAAADMNSDGHVDLVFPPRRKQLPPRPTIYLGDGKGGFEKWAQQRWPESLPWDYGDVEVADFDGDGHLDAAFAIHFKSQFVLYGDGAGVFPRGDMLPSPHPRISSRAVTAADFDGDGRQDLAFVAEVDYDITTNQRFDGEVTVWALFNRGGSWEVHTQGLPANMIADNIRAGDVNGDGRPELVVSSNSNGARELVFAYGGDDGWRPLEHRGVLSSAYHYQVIPAAGELFATFVQFRMVNQQTQARSGLVRYPLSPQGDQDFAGGVPVVWEDERKDVFFRLALGDVDGDGDTDLVAGRRESGLEVYLQTPEGLFYREQGSELEEVGRAFDIRLIDLDGDGRDDIVAGCVPQGDRPGGVYVWLSKPTV